MELLLTAVVGYLSNVTNEHVMLINVGVSPNERILRHIIHAAAESKTTKTVMSLICFI